MTQPETVYARMSLEPFRTEFALNEIRSEINARLYDVLKDDYYTKKLTESLVKLHPEIFQYWTAYRDNPTSGNRPAPIHAIGKFSVLDQKVDLVDIRFY